MPPPPLPRLPSHPGKPANTDGNWITFIFNAFLVCFGAHGLLALGRNVFGDTLASIAWTLAATLAVLILLIIGSYRKLPWKCLIPALLFSIWEGCLFIPLPAFVSLDALLKSSMVAILAISAATFAAIHQSNGGSSFFFQANSLRQREFSLSRTLIATALKLLVILPAFVLYLAWGAQVMLKEASSGFLQIDSKGLFTEARIYEKEGRHIYLLPTVHIASPSFYETLMADLPAESTVILPEGVTDQRHLIKAKIDYSQTAHAVGLNSQPDLTQKKKSADVQVCDADISDFSPSTIQTLNGVFGALQSATAGDFTEALVLLQSLGEQETPKLIEDILTTRNSRVISGINEVLPKYQHIAVPWGAAHMPGIEHGLKDMQAHFKERRRVEVLKWRELKLFPQS